jgi:nucleotide-binding universal stress UspA family protein
MSAGYRTIVVGTDGSETSYRAVDRAAALAAAGDSTLVIVSAYVAERPDSRAQDALGEDAYQVTGSAPADDAVSRARDRAAGAGAADIETDVVQGKPAEALLGVVESCRGDLLVVGNRGLNTLAGRLIGSVPMDIVRRSPVDVLIVHTT